MKKKTWNRNNVSRVVGACHFCKKEHTSNDGGWIINAEHKVFCETHTEGVSSCFDKYLKRRTVPFNDW